jgi:hypothetical protein
MIVETYSSIYQAIDKAKARDRNQEQPLATLGISSIGSKPKPRLRWQTDKTWIRVLWFRLIFVQGDSWFLSRIFASS